MTGFPCSSTSSSPPLSISCHLPFLCLPYHFLASSFSSFNLPYALKSPGRAYTMLFNTRPPTPMTEIQYEGQGRGTVGERGWVYRALMWGGWGGCINEWIAVNLGRAPLIMVMCKVWNFVLRPICWAENRNKHITGKGSFQNVCLVSYRQQAGFLGFFFFLLNDLIIVHSHMVLFTHWACSHAKYE